MGTVDNRLTLKQFVERYVCRNSLIRLWTKIPGGHQMIHQGESSVCMEHEILKNKVWQCEYCDCKVVGVTDIIVDDFYREAINIVIEK